MAGIKKKIASFEQQIETMAGLGLPMSDICVILGLSKRALERRIKSNEIFKQAIERGRAKANLNVSKKVYEMATSGEHERTSIFWLKSRANWCETSNVNLKGDIKVSTLSEAFEEIEREEREAEKLLKLK